MSKFVSAVVTTVPLRSSDRVVDEREVRARGERRRRAACDRRAVGAKRANRSGRRARGALAAPAARRHAAIAAWLPDGSTAGTSRSRSSGGRVYCGYSSRPAENDSSSADVGVAEHAGHEPRDRVDHDERARARRPTARSRRARAPRRSRARSRARRCPRSGRTRARGAACAASSRTRAWVERRARRATAGCGAAAAPRRPTLRRSRRPAARASSPCRDRRRTACRRRCGGDRS